MAQLLQSDKLMMDELEVLAAVREWATVNSVRHKYSRELRQIFLELNSEKTVLKIKKRKRK